MKKTAVDPTRHVQVLDVNHLEEAIGKDRRHLLPGVVPEADPPNGHGWYSGRRVCLCSVRG